MTDAFPEKGLWLPKELRERIGDPRGADFVALQALIAHIDKDNSSLTDHQASHIRMLRLVLVALVEGGNIEEMDHGRGVIETLGAAVDACATGMASLAVEALTPGDAPLDRKAMRSLRSFLDKRFAETFRMSLDEFARVQR